MTVRRDVEREPGSILPPQVDRFYHCFRRGYCGKILLCILWWSRKLTTAFCRNLTTSWPSYTDLRTDLPRVHKPTTTPATSSLQLILPFVQNLARMKEDNIVYFEGKQPHLSIIRQTDLLRYS